MGRFRDWIINAGGPPAVALKTGLGQAAIRAWLRREVSPRPEMMWKLIRLGDGKFNFEDILRDTRAPRKKEK